MEDSKKFECAGKISMAIFTISTILGAISGSCIFAIPCFSGLVFGACMFASCK